MPKALEMVRRETFSTNTEKALKAGIRIRGVKLKRDERGVIIMLQDRVKVSVAVKTHSIKFTQKPDILNRQDFIKSAIQEYESLIH